jgi:hypothetical protein
MVNGRRRRAAPEHRPKVIVVNVFGQEFPERSREVLVNKNVPPGTKERYVLA